MNIDWVKTSAIGGAIASIFIGLGKGVLIVKEQLRLARLAEIDKRLEEKLTVLLDHALKPVRESQQQMMLGSEEERQLQQDRHVENTDRFARLETQVKGLERRRGS